MRGVKFPAAGALLVGLLVASGPPQALPLLIDYTGFSWISAGANPQQFCAVGVVDGWSQPVNDPNETYTFYISSMLLSGIVTHSATQHTYEYSGGDFAIYRSTGPADRGYSYGSNPANGTAPSTFIDGVLWLEGGLSGSEVYFDDGVKLGSLSVQGQFIGGEFASQLADQSCFSFAGMTSRTGNGIPPGYACRLDGQSTANLTVPVPEASSLLLLGLGLCAGGILAWRGRRG